MFWAIAPLLPERLRLKILFYNTHKFWPNLRAPRTYSEKIQWRKLHDRRPLLAVFADKYLVRKYVEEKIGAKYLTQLYWVSEDARSLPFDMLPNSFAAKTNHGTRWNILVKDKRQANRDEIVAKLSAWLLDRYPPEHGEWGYSQIKPLAFAEELLTTRDGSIPPDYKFFVFNGKVRMIQVDLDRFTGHSRCLFTPDWQLMPVGLGYPKGAGAPRPDGLEEMIRCAETLAGEMDFVRADFYNVDGRIVFGELTNYPGGGFEAFSPPEFDVEVGSWWRLA